MTLKYSDLEIQILKNLKSSSSLGHGLVGVPFNSFHEEINKEIECTADELNHALKVLRLEELVLAKQSKNQITSVHDITKSGLVATRSLD